MQLSILIPARNEQFLSRTVEDILKNIRGETEVIVVLDGEFAEPPIAQDPRVTIVYHPVSIGQRAATNEAARLARGKYVMKVDAHCAFDEGFDVKMIAEMQDDVTMVPTMRNLHVFDWVCEDGHRRYQGPAGPCLHHDDSAEAPCGKPTVQHIVWHAKKSPQSTSYCFDATPHFQYFGEFAKRPEGQGDVTETMSIQGSCFMMTRERYWALNICDETWGSWGSQGIEVAVKTWLSGGRVVCNKKTWYAHLFRTQDGFGFPYPQSGNQIANAKKRARELFEGRGFAKQERPLSWLLEKFWPVPGWTAADLEAIGGKVPANAPVVRSKKPTKGVIYYTNNKCPANIMQACQRQILRGMKSKHIVSASTLPIDFGTNIVKPHEDGWIDLFDKVLIALEAQTADIIYFCETDVLYHPSHFEYVPPRDDAYYYNVNVWKWWLEDDFCARVDDCKQLSGLVANRELLLKHFRERIRRIRAEGFDRGNGFEPGTRHIANGGYDNVEAFSFSSRLPNIDIRHESNATRSKRAPDEFRNQKYAKGWTESTIDNIEGWENIRDTLAAI